MIALRRRRGRRARTAALLVAAVVVAGGAGTAGIGAAPAQAANAGSTDAQYSATQVLTRKFTNTDGTTTTVDKRTVTVNVDTTANLRGRQKVRISWSGAHPTGALQEDIYKAVGLTQEYPVVIMQCRGTDPGPEDCWTTDRVKRFPESVFASSAVWRRDAYATAEHRARVYPPVSEWPPSNLVEVQTPTGPRTEQRGCPTDVIAATEAVHGVPFVAADGTVYFGCNGFTTAPEASVVDGASSLPPNDLATVTRTDGTGWIDFEVRSAAENASLGCEAGVACSIVVVPIMGISCADANTECRKEGTYAPGALYSTVGGAPAQSVVGTYWWSASNWKGRFVVPVSFAPAADSCDVLDDRAPVDFYGSELLAAAAQQWQPAYCLSEDRFKFRYSRMIETSALTNVEAGSAVGAFVSRPETAETTDPLGYAPVAISGYEIAFMIDGPNGSGEQTQLKLTPRLIAKLLTNSYPGQTLSGTLAEQRPDLAKNPTVLQTDPEFLALNPNLAGLPRGISGASLIYQSNPSDVIYALTSYIAADPDAMAFLAGQPDPWGMTVNQAYKGITLPVGEWPLLDPWVLPNYPAGCEGTASAAWFPRVSAPVSYLSSAASAVLDTWPTATTGGKTLNLPDGTIQCVASRVDRQSFGARFILGLSALGDAERYGLHAASLFTGGTVNADGVDATFVSPDDASLEAAVSVASQEAPGGVFTVDSSALRSVPEAYPGTMIVHAAAKLSGLSATSAAQVATFIRTATTEGQVSGQDVGQLAAGYLPLTNSGSTAPLFASAQLVAAAIEGQTGRVSAPATSTPAPSASSGTSPLTGAGSGTGSGTLANTDGSAPTTTAPAPADTTEVRTGDPAPTTAPQQALSAGTTASDSSWLGRWALSLLLIAGLVGGAAALVTVSVTTRRRPL